MRDAVASWARADMPRDVIETFVRGWLDDAEGGYVLDRWTGRVERRLVERKRKRVPIREDRPNWPVLEEDPILDYIRRYRPADTMRQR